MLAPLLWLTPASRDLLFTVSKLLRGDVKCPAGKLAGLLREAEDSNCEGLLCDSTLRSDLAKEVEKLGVEISDAAAAALVDALGRVLGSRIEEIKKAAGTLSKKLPKKGAMPSFKMVADSAGTVTEALKLDWLLWHAVGNAHDPASVPAPADAVVRERIAIAACASNLLVGQSALALHVLENMDEYIKWETCIPGSKPPGATDEVLCPFDDKVAVEVAVRRILVSTLPPETANAIMAEAAGDTKAVGAALRTLSSKAQAQAVIPMYAAPPAPKEPRAPKDKKGAKDEAAADSKTAPAVPAGDFSTMHTKTQTEELQWHLLAYRLNPVTMLSQTLASTPAAPAASAPAADKGKGKSKAASSPSATKPAAAAPAAATPKGFQGVWAAGNATPPGHTSFSWTVPGASKDGNFNCIWAARGKLTPPGHTTFSWGEAGAAAPASGGSAPAAASGAKAPKGKADTPAPAKAKAKAAAPAASGAAPPEGSPEEALCKLDFRCGRIMQCEKVPDADTLYKLEINVGEEKPRQVVSSLVKHYKAEELQNRQVVVYCNIKPGKMKGIESQAMILAATADKGSDTERCELLAPPADTPEGTRAMFGGFEAGSLSDKQSLKNISKVFGAVQPNLTTNDAKEATFSGTTLTMKEAPITVASLTGVGIY